MANHTDSIRKFVNKLNNRDEQGGYWLPNIQRPFVWKENQIEKLYDSILREYPIGTLLIWKTKGNIKSRKFIDRYSSKTPLSIYHTLQNNEQKMLVLDGQQRLQSLYIGLKGDYEGKELYLDILSGDLVAPEETKFNFKFKSDAKASFPFVKFKDIVLTDKKNKEISRQLVKLSPEELSEANEERLEDNVSSIRDVFCTQDNILYQLVDSVDRPETYTEDDIVEIFIRANSGGTQLGKSDLLFSLLSASWEDAENKIDDLITELNITGFKFDRDFILKSCLVILNQGAKYEISKFRNPQLKVAIEDNWDSISASIRAVKDFVYGSTFIKTDKHLPSYLSLLPLIYSYYHFYPSWKGKENEYYDYLIKVNLTGVFGGASESFTDLLVKAVTDNRGFNKIKIFEIIQSKGKRIQITNTSLLNINYSSKEIHLLFNLWYGFNYQPSLRNNKPHIDHIFPQSELKKIKDINPDTGNRNVMKFKALERNQLGNLMLLTASENGKAGKTDTLPSVWFADKGEEYLEKHLIPRDRTLWELDKFEEFLLARNKLIINKFIDLVYIPSTTPAIASL
jgi:uncharacterized protein with ParB-like and HNH nuclease domain